MSRSHSADVASTPFSFTFDEFSQWHTELSAGLLEPARATFTRILNEILDQELSDVDRLRIRVSHSRIKSPSRLWNKMLAERYMSRIGSLNDIPEVIDDLVGVRVTCNNLVDVETFRNLVIALDPMDESELPAGLCIDPDSERHHAKESGYRAYHINLHTLIPARGAWKPARGELQVRTLLQDSWGELTHEDTYKPGSDMPALVTKFAKRMADLLATVDDLAQDLRTQLDELALHDVGLDISGEESRETGSGVTTPDSVDNEVHESSIKEAVLAEAADVITSLTRPAPLAQVAWQVQANFGREITQNWGGFGTFKELVAAAVPEAHIVATPPGYLVPPGLAAAFSISDSPDGTAPVGDPPEGIPAVVHRLKRRDPNLPAVSSERLKVLLDAVAAVLREEVWSELGLGSEGLSIREINQLSRRARDLSSESEFAPSRAMVDYTLKSIFFSQNLRPGLQRSDVSMLLEDWLFARASSLGLVSDPIDDRRDLADWFAEAV